jgi:hypothetical protein
LGFSVGAHQTGDPVRLIPCMGVLEADEGKFLFKLFRYSSANKIFILKGQFFGKDLFLF